MDTVNELPTVTLKIVHAREDAKFCQMISDYLTPYIRQGKVVVYYESSDGRELIKQERNGSFSTRLDRVDEDELNATLDLFVFLRSNDFELNEGDCIELDWVKAQYSQQKPIEIIPIRVGHFFSSDHDFLGRFNMIPDHPLRSIEAESTIKLEQTLVRIAEEISTHIRNAQERIAMQNEHYRYQSLAPVFQTKINVFETSFAFEKNFAKAFGYSDDDPHDFLTTKAGEDSFIVVEDENLWLKAVPIHGNKKKIKTEIKRLYELGVKAQVCIGLLLYDTESSKKRTLDGFRRSREEIVTFYTQTKQSASIYENSGFVMILPLKVFDREEIIEAI